MVVKLWRPGESLEPWSCQRGVTGAMRRPPLQSVIAVQSISFPLEPVRMADNRHVQTQLLDLEKAQDAMDNAVTFAQRWPQQKFNELLLRRALRIREAAEAVALACLPKN
jgi:hypothetical protein